MKLNINNLNSLVLHSDSTGHIDLKPSIMPIRRVPGVFYRARTHEGSVYLDMGESL